MSELLLGCGSRRKKLLHFPDQAAWTDLTTVDINPAHEPDVVWDLNRKPWPLDDDAFDEAHAYELLEHLGSGPGDYESFFADFSEIWRVLAPGGHLFATVPAVTSPWLWGDPSHRRQVSIESLTFLSQSEYERQVGVTAMSDFRHVYKADFELVWQQTEGDTFGFILRAVK